MPFELQDYSERDNRLALRTLVEELSLAGGDIQHEKQVMDALGCVLSGENNQELGIDHKELRLDIPAMKLHDRDCVILELALALHDIGQRLNDEPHAESGYRLLNANRPQFKAAVETHLEQWSGARPPALAENELSLVLWLVRHHDVLGNIYTGERKAHYLNSMFNELQAVSGHVHSAKHLLFVVAVTDFVGRSPGKLKRKRVDFWKSRLQEDEQKREAFPDFDQRTEQWTWGGAKKTKPGSTEHERQKIQLTRKLTDIAIRAFSQNIGHITYGLYLLQWLDVDAKPALLNRIGDVCHQHFAAEEVTLRFVPPFRRGFSAAEKLCFCDAYVEALYEDELKIVANQSQKDITVELPDELRPKEVRGTVRHTSGDSETLSAYLRKPTLSDHCRGTFKVPDDWSLTEAETLQLRLEDGRQADIRILEITTGRGIARFSCFAPLQ